MSDGFSGDATFNLRKCYCMLVLAIALLVLDIALLVLANPLLLLADVMPC